MKITLVISDLTSGGAQRVLSLLANYWSKVNHTVTIVTLDDGKQVFYPLSDKILVKSADVIFNSKNVFQAVFNNLGRIRRLRPVLLDTNPDVVISFLIGVNILVILSTLFSGLRVIISERNHPLLCTNRRYLWILLRKVFYPFAFCLVTQTEEVKSLLGNFNKNIVVIPNPVSKTTGKAVDSKTEKILPAGKIIISVGKLDTQKGFDLLLNVFSIIVKRFPDWKLVILGVGGEKEELENKCNKLSISDSVFFPGLVSNIYDLLKRCDIFVLSSRFEGFPNVLIEAMACGLPVVSFECPYGPSDIIDDGINGLLVENGNLKQMAQKIESLIINENIRNKIGQKALDVNKKYSIEKIIKEWDILIER